MQQPIFFSFKFSEWKYKHKNIESQEKNYNAHVCDVYVMFYYKIPWFYQDFKSEDLCFLNVYSVHAAKILDLSLEIMLSPLK